MKPERFLIGLDQGSSSTKGILYGAGSGRILARHRIRIATRRYEKNACLFVEQDAEEIRKSVEKTAARLLRAAPAQSRLSPMAAGIASQRSSFVLVDKKTLKPLTPAVSWQDLRGLSYVSKLAPVSKKIYEKTGLYLTPYYSLTKLLWFLDRRKDLKRKAQQGELAFCFIPTYLALRWSQGRVFAVDSTLAQRSLLMNLKTRQWDEELLGRFQLPRSLFPEILETRADYGTFRAPRSAAPILLTAMIGDQQAAYSALQSAGGLKDTALMNLGTGGFLIIPTGNQCAHAPGLLSGIQGVFNGKASYMLEGTVNSIQGTIKWMLGLGILKKSEPFTIPKLTSGEFVRRIPVVSGGFGGLAAPFWRTDIRVTVSGLDHLTTRQDLIACFLLGIAHLFWEILKPLKGSAHFPKKITASGGLSRNQRLLEIFSDYLELPIRPAQDADLTALGACVAASEEPVRLPLGLLPAVKPRKKFFPVLRRYKEKARGQLRLLLGTKAV